MVPRESWEQVRREKGELEDVVRQKEKRLKRLQEVRSFTLSFSIRYFSTPAIHPFTALFVCSSPFPLRCPSTSLYNSSICSNLRI